MKRMITILATALLASSLLTGAADARVFENVHHAALGDVVDHGDVGMDHPGRGHGIGVQALQLGRRADQEVVRRRGEDLPGEVGSGLDRAAGRGRNVR